MLIIGIGTESDSDSDSGKSEIFYRPRFGLPILIKFPDAILLGVIRCQKPDDRSNSRIYHAITLIGRDTILLR